MVFVPRPDDALSAWWRLVALGGDWDRPDGLSETENRDAFGLSIRPKTVNVPIRKTPGTLRFGSFQFLQDTGRRVGESRVRWSTMGA